MRFPDQPDEMYAPAIGRLIYYRYINPAIVYVIYPGGASPPHRTCRTPETFDLVPSTITPQARKNLGEISALLTQITSGALFGEEHPWMMSINTFVEVAIKQMGDWFLEGGLVDVTCTVLIQQSTVANVDSAETQYHAHEFLDATVQPKPIYISPNEVYAMHGLLLKHLDALVCFVELR